LQLFKLSGGLFLVAALIAALLLILPAPEGIGEGTMRAAAVMTLAVGLWATNVVPSHYGALIFLFASMVLAVAPANIVFSGFASGAVWLVFGGIVIGLSVKRTGLDMRLAAPFLNRFPNNFLAIIYGIFWISASLGFVIPSAAGRVALLIPIMMALAGRLGFKQGSKGETGLILAGTMGTMVPAFAILPANVPNMSLFGAMESVHGIHLAYGEYLALNFPVLSGGALILYPLVIWALFREPIHPSGAGAETRPWGREDGRLALILAAALVLWVTDTMHGISPAWVALGAALICTAPRIGLLPARALGEDINYGPILYVASIIGLGAVATHSGVGALIAENMLAVMSLAPGQDFSNFFAMTGIAVIVGIFTTMPAQAAILVPMAESMADASGWSLISVVMTAVPTWSIMLFPYQGPPLILALALTDLSIARLTKTLLVYFVLAAIILLPLHYQWGRMLGYFGAS
jgi:di/tricarboxylate transporter